MTRHERFIQERKYLKNVSSKTIEWHRKSLNWLGLEEPKEHQLKDCVIRMREAGLKASSVNCRLRSINGYPAWSGSALRVPRLKEEEFLPETFSAEDISKFAQWKPKTKTAQKARICT